MEASKKKGRKTKGREEKNTRGSWLFFKTPFLPRGITVLTFDLTQ
jgi:hypothetical protein